MRRLSIVASACFGLLAGCASVVSTNETARVPVPSIASTDSLADIEQNFRASPDYSEA